MIEAQRTELRARQTILRDVLLSLTFSPTRPRRTWLHLPEPWRDVAFTRACRERGVGVLPMEAVTVERNISIHTVGIHLGTRPRLGI
jgi:DNA-binding transcriptional MocR family regulator